MNVGNALGLLSIALTACAGGNARPPAVQTSVHGLAQPTNRAAARLGPPSPRGLGFRRVDRPAATEPPLALY